MSEESKEGVKELCCSVARRNWEKYSSQGQLYEYTDTANRQQGDINYLDECYRKSNKMNIDIDTILNTFIPRTMNENPTLWNPIIE